MFLMLFCMLDFYKDWYSLCHSLTISNLIDNLVILNDFFYIRIKNIILWDNIKMKGIKMIKKITIIVLTSLMFLSTGCSTYNSIVPDWAKIGDSK